MIIVDVANQQSHLPFDQGRLKDAVQTVLEEASLAEAQISLAVVDDRTIGELHGRYLDNDSPTDVISFALERSETRLEGEVVVSAQTASAAAGRYGWAAEDELLLYVIHGTLHLVGYDDTTPEKQAEMHRQEQLHLGRYGLQVRRDLNE